MAQVNRKLNRKRIEKGMTVTRLAELSDIGINTMSAILNGHRKPHATTKTQIAEALGCEVADVFEEVAK